MLKKIPGIKLANMVFNHEIYVKTEGRKSFKLILRKIDCRWFQSRSYNLNYAEFYSCNFECQNFLGMKVYKAIFQNCNMQGAKFKTALRGTDLRGADLRFADFTECDMVGMIVDENTIFGDNKFTNAKFTEAESKWFADQLK